MIEYFSRLFPTGNWNSVSESQLEKIYLGLDAWYENMIPSLKKRIIEKLSLRNRLKLITAANCMVKFQPNFQAEQSLV